MEILSYIMPPIVGAVIGYFTNYIAVKMLFRPLKPVKIGNKTLPFTPGIIPKGKPRLAKAFGTAVGTTLLTENDIKNVLLSESMQNTIKSYAERFLKSDVKIRDLAENTISPEKYEELKENLCEMLTKKIMNTMEESDIGKLIAEKGEEAIKEKISGTMMAMFIKDDLIKSLCNILGEKINEYIKANGDYIISAMIDKEVINIENKSVYELLEDSKIDIDKITDGFLEIYIKFIEKNAEEFIRNFNISGIVEEKINDMDVLMLEELLMSIMKKELNAVVNLGALIGLILGTVNIFF